MPILLTVAFFGMTAFLKQQFDDNGDYQVLQISEKQKNRELVDHIWRALYHGEICPQFNEVGVYRRRSAFQYPCTE